MNHKNVTSEINNCNNTAINHNIIMPCGETTQSSSTSYVSQPSSLTTVARLIHTLHSYFEKINVEINCIKVSNSFLRFLEN